MIGSVNGPSFLSLDFGFDLRMKNYVACIYRNLVKAMPRSLAAAKVSHACEDTFRGTPYVTFEGQVTTTTTSVYTPAAFCSAPMYLQ